MANTTNQNTMQSLKDCLTQLNFKRGNVTALEQDLLELVQSELAECEHCTGDCRKSSYRYWQPDLGADMAIRLQMDCEIPRKACKYALEFNLRKMLSRSMVPVKYSDRTFAEYEVTQDNERAIRLAKLFITSALNEQGLYIYGGAGTGKTFLASLIAREYARNYATIIFGDVPSLLDEIKRTFDGKGNAQAIIDRYGECDLLILDDLGTGQITEWSVGILYQIVNRRYNAGKLLIVTSNYDLRGLSERLIVKDKQGNVIESMTERRIVSRLSEMCIQAFLGTKDRRRQS